jgi:DNA-binding LytR/AlgR family response regulator
VIINCVIIDDEPLARKGLSEYIGGIDFLHLTGSYENPVKALNAITQGNVQLLFLDIQMPSITGLEFFKMLPHPPPVIFTTAYPQYALEGFELNALDYLVKPISFDRFIKAALKAKEYYELREKNKTEYLTSSTDHFFIKSENKLVKISFRDILFVEALQNYINIYTEGRKYITYLTFKSVEEYLPAEHFLKVHKSYIISIFRVSSIEANEIKIGIHSIPISRNLKESVIEKLLRNRFLKR